MQITDDLPEGEHSGKLAMFHDHQGADILFGHAVNGVLDGCVGGGGKKRIALHTENFTYFQHNGLPVSPLGFLWTLCPMRGGSGRGPLVRTKCPNVRSRLKLIARLHSTARVRSRARVAKCPAAKRR